MNQAIVGFLFVAIITIINGAPQYTWVSIYFIIFSFYIFLLINLYYLHFLKYNGEILWETFKTIYIFFFFIF